MATSQQTTSIPTQTIPNPTFLPVTKMTPGPTNQHIPFQFQAGQAQTLTFPQVLNLPPPGSVSQTTIKFPNFPPVTGLGILPQDPRDHLLIHEQKVFVFHPFHTQPHALNFQMGFHRVLVKLERFDNQEVLDQE